MDGQRSGERGNHRLPPLKTKGDKTYAEKAITHTPRRGPEERVGGCRFERQPSGLGASRAGKPNQRHPARKAAHHGGHRPAAGTVLRHFCRDVDQPSSEVRSANGRGSVGGKGGRGSPAIQGSVAGRRQGHERLPSQLSRSERPEKKSPASGGTTSRSRASPIRNRRNRHAEPSPKRPGRIAVWNWRRPSRACRLRNGRTASVPWRTSSRRTSSDTRSTAMAGNNRSCSSKDGSPTSRASSASLPCGISPKTVSGATSRPESRKA